MQDSKQDKCCHWITRGALALGPVCSCALPVASSELPVRATEINSSHAVRQQKGLVRVSYQGRVKELNAASSPERKAAPYYLRGVSYNLITHLSLSDKHPPGPMS